MSTIETNSDKIKSIFLKDKRPTKLLYVIIFLLLSVFFGRDFAIETSKAILEIASETNEAIATNK